MSLALLFPGQGSQYVGMGQDLANTYTVADQTFKEADDILGFQLSRLAWQGPEEELLLTKNAQPAILTHSVAVFRIISELLDVKMAAGHSLGEFSAHVAAGTFDFTDALSAVRLRGELMYSAGKVRRGTMAAVIGMDNEAVVSICEQASTQSEICTPANFNSPGQIVISGDTSSIKRAMQLAYDNGASKVVELKVSGAFHSPLMLPSEDGLRSHFKKINFNDPRYPIVSNVTSGPVTSGTEACDLLIRQLTSPVRWAESVSHMVDSGVEKFLEIGPGSVLRGLNRKNARGIPCISLGGCADLDTWKA